MEPDAIARSQIAIALCESIVNGHFSGRPVDDTMSERTFLGLFKELDPLKLYFNSSDVAQFAPERPQLDDQVCSGDVTFIERLYPVFLQRLDQRIEWALALADAPHDLNLAEEVILDGAAANYANTEAEARERMRIYVKYQLADLIADGESEAEARARLHRRFLAAKRRWHEYDAGRLFELYLTKLTSSFDPHSAYFSAATAALWRMELQLRLSGIGARLESVDGYTIIREILAGGPAAMDGRLQVGDRVVGVGQGQNGAIVDVEGISPSELTRLVRGSAGTVVRLQVIPAAGGERVIYDLTRADVQITDSEARPHKIPFDDGRGHHYLIGVITLGSFYAEGSFQAGESVKSATNHVRRIVRDDFIKAGVQGLIIDLRGNGGGYLNEANGLTGLFIDGPTYQVKNNRGIVSAQGDPIPGTIWNGAMMVLINKHSASASELFAKAMHDYRRASIVGDSSTYGKGTVQDLTALVGGPNEDLGQIKLTRMMFYGPDGDSTQLRGQRADVVLPSTTDLAEYGESSYDYVLPFDHVNATPHQSSAKVDEALLGALRSASNLRQQSSAELQSAVARRDLSDARIRRQRMTFSLAILQQENRDLPRSARRARNRDQNQRFGEDAYTREVLQILADQIRLTTAAAPMAQSAPLSPVFANHH
jgi:carboxyl-terminal processing protease